MKKPLPQREISRENQPKNKLFQPNRALTDHGIALQPAFKGYRRVRKVQAGHYILLPLSLQVVASVDGVSKICIHLFLIPPAAIGKRKARASDLDQVANSSTSIPKRKKLLDGLTRGSIKKDAFSSTHLVRM
jgi:hypothetical protein